MLVTINDLTTALNTLLRSAAEIPASDLRAFEAKMIAFLSQLEARTRGSRIFRGELNGGAPDPSLGLEGDLYVERALADFYEFVDGQWVYLFNGKGRVGTFVPLAANQYGAHPAFNTQRDLDIWLLQHANGSSGPPLPTISGFAPASGAAGSTVVITGTHFTGATVVSVNSGAVASYSVDSPTQITATLSNAQTTGLVRVTTPGGTATSATAFTVTPASPTGLTVYDQANAVAFVLPAGESLTDYGF
jgi:hypothetical protein